MQPVLVFENAGELDPRFLSTFGCSVKESDNPIGWFGTGLKFAIAVLLRTGHSIRVLTGTRQLEITTRTDTLRGQSFAFVCVDGEPAGFTTELGKNWELWMAYRELYCNTKDEPAATIFETRRAPRPEIGRAHV